VKVGAAAVGTVAGTVGMPEVGTIAVPTTEVAVPVPEPPLFWLQSASPKTARQRLIGMSMRPLGAEADWLQVTLPRTAMQTLIGTLMREPWSLEALEACWHLASPRAARQAFKGTSINPPAAEVVWSQVASPRIPAHRPIGMLMRLSWAATDAASARPERMTEFFIVILFNKILTFENKSG
jgi:hypothetical protein